MFGLTQHYTVLGVGPSATIKEVKSAYIRLARQFHPDKIRQPTTPVNSFVAIRNAYEAINADLIRRQTEQNHQRRLNNLKSRLNVLTNILEDSDVSSDSDDFSDDYFEARMKVMDQQFQSIQDILNHRNTPCESVKQRKPKLRGGAWKDVIDTDSSEKSETPEHSTNSSMLIEEDLNSDVYQPFSRVQQSKMIDICASALEHSGGRIVELLDIIQSRMGKEFTEKDRERLLQKKQRQKAKKQKKKEERQQNQLKRVEIRKHLAEKEEDNDEPAEVIDLGQNILTGKYYEQFHKVFEKAQEKAIRYTVQEPLPQQKKNEEAKVSGENGEATEKVVEEKKSRKKKKMERWLRVAQLKAIVKRPDLVEAWDITAMDPLFLAELKTIKNTVPVPRHWNQKSKFLQSKRGILKPMFKLPEFIEATGISKLRDPFSERDGQKMVREKLKERMNPRLGKIDIDYGVLHDAFFKYQTKSKMTIFGDTYYEGKEQEAKAKLFKPGVLSEELRMALGISDFQAPPWIINIQRYGAPPSYPTLRILGCNAPFSELNSYSMISKANLEEAAKKSGHAGLYATFRSYYDEDEDHNVDKGYWGEINDEEIPEEEPEQMVQEDEGLDQMGGT